MTNSSLDLVGLMLFATLFFLGFLITTYFAKIKGFFSLPFKSFIGSFCSGADALFNISFFVASFVIGGMIISKISSRYVLSPVLIMALGQSAALVVNLLFILSYSLVRKDFHPLKLIKDRYFPGKKPFFSDMENGFKALLLSIFPLFTIMCLYEIVVSLKGGDAPGSQDAVGFLIQAAKDSSAIYPAIFAVVVAAPCIEEFLFRGVIQSYFRRKYGTKLAIILASLLFSVFHFSLAQGFQNIFILLSLFILSLYLGFIYEKTRSLISPITLHVTFNLINTIIIILSTM